LVEKIFHAFDFLKYDEVENLILKLKGKNLNLLDNQTHAFYISVLGILEKQNGNYQEALTYMDRAISLLKKSNPADLPNIYRKKIEIYTQLKENDLALAAYDSGIMYANKYNIMVYKIGMNESLRDHYRTMENYQRAFYHQQLVDTLKFQYNFTNKSSQIIHFEKELSEKRKNEELESERSLKISLLIISICIGAFALFIYFLFHSNKKKNEKIREENERIRKELDKLVNLSEDSKIYYSEYELTPRQIEIIELVRQGKTNKAIGEQLFISENTVKYHLRTIYSILGIENRYDLK
jgi:DNA-binding CsgD family transcriptional regulator